MEAKTPTQWAKKKAKGIVGNMENGMVMNVATAKAFLDRVAVAIDEETLNAVVRDRELTLMTRLDDVVQYLRQDHDPKKRRLAERLEVITREWQCMPYAGE